MRLFFKKYGGIIATLVTVVLLIVATVMAGTGFAAFRPPLNAPANIRVEGDFLCFDAVEGANQYRVSVNNSQPLDYTSTTIDVSVYLAQQSQEIKFSVIAMDTTGKHRNSDATVYVYGKNTEKPAYVSAGLYKTGSNYSELITPWHDLQADGVLDAYGRVAPGREGELAGDLALDSSISQVAGSMYQNCSLLTGLLLPAGIVNVMSYDWDKCEQLVFNEYKNALYLGCNGNPYYALISPINRDVEECDIHKDTKVIASHAFLSCEKLTSIEIPAGVVAINNGAFMSCTRIESVIIPASVNYLGKALFRECASLRSITVDKNNKVYCSDANCVIDIVNRTLIIGCMGSSTPINSRIEIIGEDAFNGCAIREFIVPSGVSAIEASAFANCSQLESIDLPNSITSIGDGAFKGCASLTSVTIPPMVKVIRSDTFLDCSDLKEVIFAEKGLLTSIYSYAFKGCKSLTNIILPQGITLLGDSVFANCELLETVVLSDGIPTLHGDVFRNCSSLREITIPGSIEKVSIYSSLFSLEKIIYSGSTYQWKKYNVHLTNGVKVVCSDGVLEYRNGTYRDVVDG